MKKQKFYNATQAAEFVGVSRKHFYRLCEKFDTKPIGREAHMPLYSKTDLDLIKIKQKEIRALYGKIRSYTHGN